MLIYWVCAEKDCKRRFAELYNRTKSWLNFCAIFSRQRHRLLFIYRYIYYYYYKCSCILPSKHSTQTVYILSLKIHEYIYIKTIRTQNTWEYKNIESCVRKKKKIFFNHQLIIIVHTYEQRATVNYVFFLIVRYIALAPIQVLRNTFNG